MFCNFTLCTYKVPIPSLGPAQSISSHLKAHNAKVVYMMQRFQSWAFVIVNIDWANFRFVAVAFAQKFPPRK